MVSQFFDISRCIPFSIYQINDNSTPCLPIEANKLFNNNLRIVSMLIIILIIGVVIVIENCIVILLRSLMRPTSTVKKVNNFFIKNLAFCDVLMGLYLISIFLINWYHRKIEELWQMKTCTTINIIYILSSIQSMFILTVMAIYRTYTIMKPLQALVQGSRKMKTFIIVSWFLVMIVLGLARFELIFVALINHHLLEVLACMNASFFIILNVSNALILFKAGNTKIVSHNRFKTSNLAFRIIIALALYAVCCLPLVTFGIRFFLGFDSRGGTLPVILSKLFQSAGVNPILHTLYFFPYHDLNWKQFTSLRYRSILQ